MVQKDPSTGRFVSAGEQKSPKFPVKLIALKEVFNKRRRIAHSGLKSVHQQQLFIDACQHLNFPDEYNYTGLIESSRARSKCEIHSYHKYKSICLSHKEYKLSIFEKK